jgi:hypothetical protein
VGKQQKEGQVDFLPLDFVRFPTLANLSSSLSLLIFVPLPNFLSFLSFRPASNFLLPFVSLITFGFYCISAPLR